MTEDPRIDPVDLRNRRFPGSSRKYDAKSVDGFLRAMAERVEATNRWIDDLQAELASARATPSATSSAAVAPPMASSELSLLSDDELLRLVGEETTAVLATARRAAEDIRSKAEESVARVIRDATSEAGAKVEAAERKAAELTALAERALDDATVGARAEADRIRSEAERAAEAMIASAQDRVHELIESAEQRQAEAREEASAIREQAREEGRQMIAEAKEVRVRVFDDLQRRRSAARAQIDTLLAGRERLLEAYSEVRRQLDAITEQLHDVMPGATEPDEATDSFGDGSLADLPGSATRPAEPSGEPADDIGSPRPGDDEVFDDTVFAEAVFDEPESDELEFDDDTVVDDSTVAGGEDPIGGADVDDTVASDDIAAEETTGSGEVALESDARSSADGAPDASAAADQESGDELETSEGRDDLSNDDEGSLATAPAGGTAAPDATASGGGADAQGAGAAEEDGADTDAAADTGADRTGSDVDALFARMRADRERSVARAHEVLDPEPGVDGDAAPGDADAVGEEASDPPAAVAADPDPATEGVPADSPLMASVDQLTHRTGVLAELDPALSRSLKRHLADEQNSVLDRLRRSRSPVTIELFSEAEAHVAEYARVARPSLAAAAAAGLSAVGDHGSGSVDVAALAWSLGAALVEPFRRRVERAIDELEGDPDELDERLRSLYREWKVQQVGPAASDALLTAYAMGTRAGVEAGMTVRWLVDPAQGPCPDAEDNALAGAIGAEDVFPTGDRCPQAHPGCRCLLVVEH